MDTSNHNLTEIEFIRTDFDARAQFTSDTTRTFVVLFKSGRDRAAGLRFARMTWPLGWERRVVDVQLAPRTARWFGIRQAPAIAVIRGGTLLALEHRCELDVCARLAWWANAQQARMSAL